MKGILGLVSTLAVGAAALSGPQEAKAGWGVETVNCYSEGGRRSYCRVPWRDARLVRQDSRAACVRGHTWGMDRGGIWVDDGCRGLFEDAHARGRYDGPGPGWHNGHYIPYDGNRRYDRYDRYHDDRRGYDRDYDRPPPWRDDRHGRPAHGGRPGGDGRIVSCDSNDNKRVFCHWPIGQGARLVEQTSRSDCREGYSYGFTRDGIWAAKGCRGKFNIGY